jgi:hypothetical protein
MDSGKPVLFQKQRHLHAAAAVVAEGDDVLRFIDLGEAARYLAHRHGRLEAEA